MNQKNRSLVTPVIGLQWGDEGKGKGIARIASSLKKDDLIVRFQGGNNAGHTIWHDKKQYVFHLIPSGVFGVAQMHLGAGMVINPTGLFEESKIVPKNTNFLDRISVSPHAVLTIPTHLILDSISEKSKGGKKIGTTGKGIAPSYTDITLRRALRVGDIFFSDFKKRYTALREEHKKYLLNLFEYKIPEEEFKKNEKMFWKSIKFLRSLKRIDSSEVVSNTLAQGYEVIAEGAQGALLDIRFGHYPFVTASHTISSGVGTGLGIPPSSIGGAIGVFKAYATKVGEGPFPTELGGKKSAIWCRDQKSINELEKFPDPNPNSKNEFEQGIALRRRGNEIGATTGRLRRTGWADIPLLKYAIEMNNATELVLTKLDVLDGFEEIKVCTSYIINGKQTSQIPFDISRADIKPIYKIFKGWSGKLSHYEDKLPKEALSYVKFLEKELGAKITYVGIGVEEHHVIERYWE